MFLVDIQWTPVDTFSLAIGPFTNPKAGRFNAYLERFRLRLRLSARLRYPISAYLPNIESDPTEARPIDGGEQKHAGDSDVVRDCRAHH